MEFTSKVVLPIALALLMFALGMELTLQDFRRVAMERRPALTGLASLLLGVPLLGLLLATHAKLPPALALGLFMVSTCPGGTFSNLLTLYGKGDLPLSISMTAIGSLLYVVTAPLWVGAGVTATLGTHAQIHLSHLTSFEDLTRIVVLPVAAGMLARRHIADRLRTRIERVLRDGAALAIVAIFLFIFWRTRPALNGHALVAVLILNMCTVFLGWGAARLARLPRAAVTSIVCEHAVRQEGTGIYIVTAMLGIPTAAIPLILNSFVGLALGSSYVLLQIWRQKERGMRRWCRE